MSLTPAANLPPVLLTPVANLPPVSTTLVKLVAKFAAGVVDNRRQICHRCRWYRWSTLSCEYLREFSKKFETALMVYSGPWGKLIHEKLAAGVVDTGGNLPPVLLTPAANLPPVLLTPVANLPPVSTTLVKLVAKFAAGVVDNRRQICHRCCWYRWSTLSCEYLREFSKKFETALMVYSGPWGKLIHEKNQKQKISWHCPFKTREKKFHVVRT